MIFIQSIVRAFLRQVRSALHDERALTAASSRHSRLTAGAAALLGLCTLVVGQTAACVDQPVAHCTISGNIYAAKYTYVSGATSGDCAIPGEILGAQAYVVDPSNPGDRISSIALKSELLGTFENVHEEHEVRDANPAHKSYAFGKFTSVDPDANNICTVPTLSVAELNLPALPPGPDPDEEEGTAAIDAKYEWKNVTVFVTAAQTGSQFAGELKLTRNGCSAEYRVQAIAPAVSCDNGAGAADDSLCKPFAPKESERVHGSGFVSPDVVVVCDPKLLLCVPALPFPSLK